MQGNIIHQAHNSTGAQGGQFGYISIQTLHGGCFQHYRTIYLAYSKRKTWFFDQAHRRLVTPDPGGYEEQTVAQTGFLREACLLPAELRQAIIEDSQHAQNGPDSLMPASSKASTDQCKVIFCSRAPLMRPRSRQSEGCNPVYPALKMRNRSWATTPTI